jgi:hypothetical protein
MYTNRPHDLSDFWPFFTNHPPASSYIDAFKNAVFDVETGERTDV